MDMRIGAQLFSTRDLTQTPEDFDKLCSELNKIGYKIVQISGCPLEAKVVKETLDKYDLKAVVTHRPFDEFKNNIDAVIDYHKTLDCDICGLGMMPKEYLESTQTLNEFLKIMNKACDELSKEGLYFGYHNHSLEFIKLGGKRVFDIMVNETNPEAYNFILDTYWCQHSGVNPAEMIRSLKKRAMVLHFKDFAVDTKEFKPKMEDVGCGNINWDSIISAGKDAGSRWALVERDDAPDYGSISCMKNSYDFLTTKGFI